MVILASLEEDYRVIRHRWLNGYLRDQKLPGPTLDPGHAAVLPLGSQAWLLDHSAPTCLPSLIPQCQALPWAAKGQGGSCCPPVVSWSKLLFSHKPFQLHGA